MSVFFWLTLLIVAVPLTAAGWMVKDILPVHSAGRLEIVRDPLRGDAYGPETPRLPGEPLAQFPRVVLPFSHELADVPGLKRTRYQLLIDPPLAALSGIKSDADSPDRAPNRSLLISQAHDGMDIYLNGVWIAGLPKSDAVTRYKWFRPLAAPLARRLLRSDGPNIVTIESTTWDSRVLIPPIYVGNASSVTVVTDLIQFIGSSLANASNVFCLLAGMFLLGAWLANRRDGSIFGHAGATTVIWSVLFTLVLLPRVPVGFIDAWMWAQYACIGALVTVLTFFIFAFIKQPMSPGGRWLLFATAAAAPVLYPWLGVSGRYWLDMIWLPALLMLHLYACSKLVRHVVRHRSRASVSLLAQSLLAQVFALHDHNVRQDFLLLDGGGSGWNLSHLLATPMFLSHLSVPLLLFVVARILLGQFQANVARIRDANLILADTLQQRERELRVSYNRQREMENEVAAQAERDRIYRDLHDGIGSKLVTTLFSVRDRQINHEQLETRLLEALTDIREIISVSAPQEHRSLQEVLFTYCSDLDESLSAADFQIEFELSDEAEVVLLGDRTKQVMRIVEESVANTVKYARATRLTIRLEVREAAPQTGAQLLLCIDDNGRGDAAAPLPALLGSRSMGETSSTATSDPESAPTATVMPPGSPAASPRQASASPLSGGRGLQGMRRRAVQLGGCYQFERTPEGARTRLWLPLVGGEPPPSEGDSPTNESAGHRSQWETPATALA